MTWSNMKRLIWGLLLVVSCNATPSNDKATDDSVALSYTDPAEVAALYDSLFTALVNRYEQLREERIAAYAATQNEERDSLLRANDTACAALSEELAATDKEWLRVSRELLERCDSSFTELCALRGIDSATLANRVRR